MASTHSRNGWIVWLTFAIGMLLSVSPLPQFMEILRPLWLALLLAFWSLNLPHIRSAWSRRCSWAWRKMCSMAPCWARTR